MWVFLQDFDVFVRPPFFPLPRSHPVHLVEVMYLGPGLCSGRVVPAEGVAGPGLRRQEAPVVPGRPASDSGSRGPGGTVRTWLGRWEGPGGCGLGLIGARVARPLSLCPSGRRPLSPARSPGRFSHVCGKSCGPRPGPSRLQAPGISVVSPSLSGCGHNGERVSLNVN